jgi:hypothetical protein
MLSHFLIGFGLGFASVLLGLGIIIAITYYGHRHEPSS